MNHQTVWWLEKLTVITFVMIMLAVSVVPALAAGGPPADRGTANGNCSGNPPSFGVSTPYALSGTIAAIDSGARTVTVTVACGNRLVKPYTGQNVTLQTTDYTRFLLRNADGSVTPITFENLAVDQKVSSHGTLVEGVWTATRITVGALLYCLP